MWLLKTGAEPDGTASIELKQFWGSVVEPYAILSHRWSANPDDEVSFADVRYLARPRPEDNYERQIILAKPGYRKLIQAIRKARSDGWQYIWIDTCCIDKDSSVALSEAINSMYRYYQQSAVCYAHLADVIQVADLEASVYFKRGWTLQELLAPNNLIFTNRDWTNIGTKQSLAHRVSMCTSIPRDYLLNHTPVSHASIAERMSWAADRELSREEDVAYSLLGLFNVNMYQLYGEGKQRAFQRLQEEILKQNDEDQTIFAWNKPSSSTRPFPTDETVFQECDYHGLLADGPEDFRACGGMQVLEIMSNSTPPMMTARGLQLSLPLTAKTKRLAIATLYCPAVQVPNGLFGLYLLQLDDKPNSYVRVCCDIKIFLYEPGPSKNLYVVQNYVTTPRNAVYPFHRLQLKYIRGFDADGKKLYLGVSTREADTGQYSDRPQAYKINKQPHVVSATVRVREFNHDRGFDIAFAAVPGAELTWAFSGSDGKVDSWKPRVSGSTVTLSWCKVTVWIEEEVVGDTKWFIAKVEARVGAEGSSVTVMDHPAKGGGALRTGLRRLVSGNSAS